jgi:hypothetical protein
MTFGPSRQIQSPETGRRSDLVASIHPVLDEPGGSVIRVTCEDFHRHHLIQVEMIITAGKIVVLLQAGPDLIFITSCREHEWNDYCEGEVPQPRTTLQYGPVPFSCRPKCSFKPLSVRTRRGFSSLASSDGDADCRSR